MHISDKSILRAFDNEIASARCRSTSGGVLGWSERAEIDTIGRRRDVRMEHVTLASVGPTLPIQICQPGSSI